MSIIDFTVGGDEIAEHVWAGTSRLSGTNFSFCPFLPISARSSGRPFQLLLCLALAITGCAIADLAIADPMPGEVASEHNPLVFDIEPQPLASALSRYGDLTGREVLYNTALVQGRVSAPARGVLTPETALSRLLDGTGLSAQFMSDGSFVLTTGPTNQRRLAYAAPGSVQDSYYGQIQVSLRRALCASVGGYAGRYRVAALFWIGSSGRVARYERLGTAGNSDLDQAIDQTLRDLQIGGPPPAGFRQPVLTMVVPKSSGVTMDCDRPQSTQQDAQRAAGATP